MRKGKKYIANDADREFVRRAITAGTSVNKTAAALNLSDDTLRKNYRYEIMTAREVLKGLAIRCLEDCLIDGSLDAAKFILARVAHWKETTSNEVSGKDGGPIELTRIERIIVDPTAADG